MYIQCTGMPEQTSAFASKQCVNQVGFGGRARYGLVNMVVRLSGHWTAF